MGRLTIFAKGNLDLRDSLHSLKQGNNLLWNGINEVVRARYPRTVIRLRHEVWTRSDALLASNGEVPSDLASRPLPLEPYTAASQFSRAVFETDAGAIILSLLPDATSTLFRHRREGYLFYPHDWRSWDAADRTWLREAFEKLDLLDVDTSMENFAAIIARIRERSSVPILIYNLSSVVPGESVHCHSGLGDIFSTRIRKFNLGLIGLSQRSGVSLIDIDTLFARAGAGRLKLDAVHFTAEGCRLVAEEVVRVLDDLGCFSSVEMQQCM